MVLWLGVLSYPTIQTVSATLTALSGLGAVDVIFDSPNRSSSVMVGPAGSTRSAPPESRRCASRDSRS